MKARIDQQRFDAFAEHLVVLDAKLQTFAANHDFALEINPFRQPCRYLRRPGNPHYLVDISLDRYWVSADLEEDMQHSVTAIAYYRPADEPDVVWRKAVVVMESLPFSQLVQLLDNALQDAVGLISQWSPETIMRSGEKQENLGFKFRDHF